MGLKSNSCYKQIKQIKEIIFPSLYSSKNTAFYIEQVLHKLVVSLFFYYY